jgi:hypothetical protein
MFDVRDLINMGVNERKMIEALRHKGDRED